MSGVEPSGERLSPRVAAVPASPAEVPEEYSEAYQRAYRRSLAEHPTELMSPARPGKRAAVQSVGAARKASVEKLVVGVLTNRRQRLVAAAASGILLLVFAYGVGRLLS